MCQNSISAGGAYSAPPDTLAGFKGPTSKGRGGKAREGGMGGKGEEREGAGGGREGEERGGKRREGKGREGGLTPHFSLPSVAPSCNNKPREFSFVHYISWILMFLSVVACRICKLLC